MSVAVRAVKLLNKRFIYDTYGAAILMQSVRWKSDTEDVPVKYTTSNAYKWKARYTFYGANPDLDNFPWYQPKVVALSLAVFMLYFFVFREENDMDEYISESIYTKIPGLEKKQILLCIKTYEENGKDTTDLKKRLREILAEELENEKT